MKHVGILAHSAEGSSLCYLALCHAGASKLGDHLHPDVTMDAISMGASIPDWERENFPPIRATLAKSVGRLSAADCDFFVCPDNTAHLALEVDGPDLALPGLHIADVVTKEAVERGYRKLGILGTKWTMARPMYFRAALSKGLTAIAPNEPDRNYINGVIFSELCKGIFNDNSRMEHVRIMEDLKSSGCDAVVLGCTEIPLLISSEQSPLPILDSTRLLAKYALGVALGENSLPSWRGGPMWP
ncbi:amino acid racemase [Mesorhizobium intechi]|uniref:aspartate/glutamate racemase family protein n=1 Tax=Mesorhizobium intechi TaxID=537601 RepID=UPI000CA9DED5|nr:amino acid racemase [Mesorhizobium intechi]